MTRSPHNSTAKANLNRQSIHIIATARHYVHKIQHTQQTVMQFTAPRREKLYTRCGHMHRCSRRRLNLNLRAAHQPIAHSRPLQKTKHTYENHRLADVFKLNAIFLAHIFLPQVRVPIIFTLEITSCIFGVVRRIHTYTYLNITLIVIY